MPNRAYEQTLLYYIRTMIHAPEEAELSVEDLPDEMKPLGEALRTLGDSIRKNQNAGDNEAAADNVDPATGLYNIYQLMDELRRCKESRKPVSLMMIGANQFRNINKSYGFEFGNKVLRLFADELVRLTRGYGSVFRFNGVKFCVLIDRLCGREEMERLCDQVCDIARNHLAVEDQAVSLTVSASSLSFQRIELEENDILAELEYAMSISKKESQGKLVHFDDSLHNKANRQMDLIDTLIHSVLFNDFHGFFLEYQPQVCQDGTIVGAEALVRWQDSEWGRVPPNDFIPILENDSCFYELGLWILETALRQVQPIIHRHPAFFISVNVSYRQLEQPHFKTDVLEIIDRLGFPAKNLTLELTEHCRTIQQDVLTDNLNFLRAAGIRISADDFGTGYSSLAMLRDLPFDEIKIDRTFIKNIVENNPDKIIVRSTIQCAKDFGIRVCIEGVEDVPTLVTVEEFNPDYYQGYLYSKPVSLELLLSLCLEHDEPKIQIERPDV